MKRAPSARAAALATLAALLAACGSTPPAPAPAMAPSPVGAAPAPAGPAAGIEAFERRQRARADQAARQGRLGDAVVAWESLVALRPEQRDYREHLAATRALVQSTLAERLPKAEAAARRGDLDGASQQYLSLLTLDPLHEGAAEALRQIERERNKRHPPGARFVARRGPANDVAAKPAVPPKPVAAARADADRNTVEHAAMLATQGELDEAIAMLRTPAAGHRADTPAARKLLAELLVQKAERIAANDRAGAIAALERSLQLDPAQPAARQRLQVLRDGGSPSPPATTPARRAVTSPS